MGARICAIDRPSVGFSGQISGAHHFGHVAHVHHEALTAHGVRGNLILVFHSLGSFLGLALAAEVRDDPNFVVVGAVAVDASDPEWPNSNTPRNMASDCNKNAEIQGLTTLVFAYRMFWTLVPSGVTRLLF